MLHGEIGVKEQYVLTERKGVWGGGEIKLFVMTSRTMISAALCETNVNSKGIYFFPTSVLHRIIDLFYSINLSRFLSSGI